MEYVTFVSHKRTWRLHRGIGSDGGLLAERIDSPLLLDLSAAQQPILWVSGHVDSNRESIIQRLTLPDLESQPIPWNGGRVGALTNSPDGQQAVALELPEQPHEQPRLWLWKANTWNAVEVQVIPDISSKLAWLDATQIVYESNSRQLTIYDLGTSDNAIGPLGCCPTVAGELHEWYAINNGRVLRFPLKQSFVHPPEIFEGFSFGHVTTLRVTRDGRVATWTEPRLLYQSKGFLQERGSRRKRFRELDEGIGAVLGPYSFV
jgi:hypothetical protein